MLNILSAVERELPLMLQDEGRWQSLYVDYHPPTVERLWTRWGDYRVYLHRILPCGPGEALFHPHPWPSAMRVLSGEYEMAAGYGKGEEAPPIAVRLISAGDFRYEMTDPDAWHYVRPIGEPTLSVMVTGKRWERWSPRSDKPLAPLEERTVAELLGLFRERYGVAEN